MSRLIDADAFDERVRVAGGMAEEELTEDFIDGVLAVLDMLRNQPAIQPKKGNWIKDRGQQIFMQNFIERGEVWRVCSVCGAGHMIGHKYASEKAYHDMHHNFCPNCGAKMEGVDDE